jgi:hypothetical protein
VPVERPYDSVSELQIGQFIMSNGTDMDIDFTRRNKKPRPLSDSEKEKLDEFVDAIHYSARSFVSASLILLLIGLQVF